MPAAQLRIIKSNTMETIECQPPKEPRLNYLLLPLFNIVPAGLVFVVLYLISELITGFKTSQSLKITLFVLSYIVSSIGIYYFLIWHRERWFWKLTDSELISGKRKPRSYPLSTISQIIQGLPHKFHFLLFANRYLNPAMYKNLIFDRDACLLIKFMDGSMLPLHVYRCVNGPELMAEIVNRYEKLIDRAYQYNNEEVKLLKNIDWNRLIKPNIL